MATNLLEVVETEDLATKEIFGDGVQAEISNALKILNDFADFYMSIRRDKQRLRAEIKACTRKGEVARVMARIRREYM